MATTAERGDAVAVFRGIRRDPVAFLRDVLRFEPWSKQSEIIESVRDHKRTAVRSAHGVGKTAIAARAALWFLAGHPRSRVITTAPTWAQVKHQLWREIASAYRSADGFFDGVLTETRLDLAPEWFAIGLSTDRPERFQGHHAEQLLLIVDEASGVDEGIFEAAESFLTSEGARALLIGNPTRPSGTFFDAFHRDRAAWNTITVSALQTPSFTGETVPDGVLRRLVSRAWVEERRRKWGERSPLYQVRVLGDFPSTADDTVVALAEVEAAQLRAVEPGLPVLVGVDVARFGSDETVIAVRHGGQVRIADAYGGRDTMETAGRVIRAARDATKRSGVRPKIVVDDVGVGGGVTDRLREISDYTTIAFNGGSTARARGEYPNRRSEAWFDFAEQLPELDLDDDEQLAADLVAPRYSIDSAGRRVVEAKDVTKTRLGRSPDRADAVLLTFAGERGAGSASVGGGRDLRADLIGGGIDPTIRDEGAVMF